MKPDEALIAAAVELSSSAPRQWQEFLAALKLHSDKRRDECVRAPSAEVFIAQGRAQESSTLVDTLTGCRQTWERIRLNQK